MISGLDLRSVHLLGASVCNDNETSVPRHKQAPLPWLLLLLSTDNRCLLPTYNCGPVDDRVLVLRTVSSRRFARNFSADFVRCRAVWIAVLRVHLSRSSLDFDPSRFVSQFAQPRRKGLPPVSLPTTVPGVLDEAEYRSAESVTCWPLPTAEAWFILGSQTRAQAGSRVSHPTLRCEVRIFLRMRFAGLP